MKIGLRDLLAKHPIVQAFALVIMGAGGVLGIKAFLDNQNQIVRISSQELYDYEKSQDYHLIELNRREKAELELEKLNSEIQNYKNQIISLNDEVLNHETKFDNYRSEASNNISRAENNIEACKKTEAELMLKNENIKRDLDKSKKALNSCKFQLTGEINYPELESLAITIMHTEECVGDAHKISREIGKYFRSVHIEYMGPRTISTVHIRRDAGASLEQAQMLSKLLFEKGYLEFKDPFMGFTQSDIGLLTVYLNCMQ